MPKQRVDDIQDKVSKQETGDFKQRKWCKKSQMLCMDFRNDAHVRLSFQGTEQKIRLSCDSERSKSISRITYKSEQDHERRGRYKKTRQQMKLRHLK